ncbi:MAG: hypothetical protein EPO61_04165 [Nitrospirae bacterium]|nr:MAG: hypothetical protein EPO61_04165 [Nitrospirota bacterium]
MTTVPEFEEHEGYLFVRIPPCDSVEQMCANAKWIATECHARGFSKVLLDTLLITNLPPAGNLYEVGARCADLLVDHLKVAAVVCAQATSSDRSFENVLRNRGINYRWFLDAEQAKQWLVKDDVPK